MGIFGLFWISLESVWRHLKKFCERCRVFQLGSFLWSIAPMFLKFTQNNAMAIRNMNCEKETVIGTFEQIIRNSVENSVFSRLCHISWAMFPKILQLTEGYILIIWNILESDLRLSKNSAEDSVFSKLCYFRRSVAPMILKLHQNNA